MYIYKITITTSWGKKKGHVIIIVVAIAIKK